MHKINSFSPFSVRVIKDDILILASKLAPPLLVRGHPYMTSTKFWDSLTPSPLSAFGTDLQY